LIDFIGGFFTTSNKETLVSKMCKINDSCCAKQGLCIHEKMMMGAVVLLMSAAIAYWIYLIPA